MSDVDMVVSTLVGAYLWPSNDFSDLILHSVDFNRKCEIMNSVISMANDAPLFKEIIGLIDKAEKLMAKRHIIAHGMLGENEGNLAIASMTLPAIARYATRPKIVAISSLDKFTESAHDVADRLHAIVADLNAMREADE